MSDLCALASQVASEHGDPVIGSIHGVICARCYQDRVHRGLELVPGGTFAGVPSYLRSTFLYAVVRGARGARGGMRIKRARPTLSAREPYVRMRSRDLLHLVQRLPGDLGAPLLLQLEEGLSYVEIAERLGVREVTVRERLRRARVRLRELQAA